jgi:ribosome biogenesis GTPase
LPSGIIMKGIGGFYYVLSGRDIYECKARGIFRKNEVTPLPGDEVEFSIQDEEKKTGSIDGILPRKTLLVRPAVANVSQIIAVIAVKSPEPDLLLLDKLLVTAEKECINAVVCINKIDLDDAGECGRLAEIYAGAGYTVIPASSRANVGFEKLREVLRDRTTVFAGQSGVGKSTLLNRVMDAFVMKTGALSGKIERGRHTTRHAELIPLSEGGYLVDTPGFSSFELAGIEYGGLKDYFHEFSGLGKKCRFTGCSHISEPDCAVKKAVSAGAVEAGRYERYVALYGLLKQLDDMKYKKTGKEREKK